MFTNGITKARLFSILGLLLLVIGIPITLSTLRQQQITQNNAQVNSSGSNQDTCHLIRVSWTQVINGSNASESQTCNKDTKSYGLKMTITSQDGKKHTFDYITYRNFCTSGSAQPCTQNLVASEANGSTGDTITVAPQSPLGGASSCGTYQDDLVIKNIDGNKNCSFGASDSTKFGSSNPGGAGLCQTGVTCAAACTTKTYTECESGNATYCLSHGIPIGHLAQVTQDASCGYSCKDLGSCTPAPTSTPPIQNPTSTPVPTSTTPYCPNHAQQQTVKITIPSSCN